MIIAKLNSRCSGCFTIGPPASRHAKWNRPSPASESVDVSLQPARFDLTPGNAEPLLLAQQQDRQAKHHDDQDCDDLGTGQGERPEGRHERITGDDGGQQSRDDARGATEQQGYTDNRGDEEQNGSRLVTTIARCTATLTMIAIAPGITAGGGLGHCTASDLTRSNNVADNVAPLGPKDGASVSMPFYAPTYPDAGPLR